MDDSCRDHGPCQIVPVGRRRDGGTKFWCLKHRADATAKYGRAATVCLRAHLPEPNLSEKVTIDLDEFPGGFGLWGAVPPVYDSTIRPMDRGIHVHARRKRGGQKVIDKTFRVVTVVHQGNRHTVDELDAIYFMVSTQFRFPVKSLCCDKCGHSHLDKDWFAVHPHQVHLCSGCGRRFRDEERAICNPVGVVREVSGLITPPPKAAERTIEINQEDYPGGVQVWASNPAILWAGEITPESGIHIHAFASASDDTPVIDDTYSRVVMDGVKLDVAHIRNYMAQRAMPHIIRRVAYLRCQCGNELFSEHEHAYTPAEGRRCEICGQVVKPRSRFRKVIANPLLRTLEVLAQSAPRPVQHHDMKLLQEAP